MKPNLLLSTFILLAVLCGPAWLHAQETVYTLDACYRSALAHAEKIGVAQEAVALAEYTRKQALSVLMPTITAFGNYRHYSQEEYASNVLLQPEWDGSYGIRLGQSFTLNGRELTALRIAEQGIEKSRSDLDATTEAYLFTVASAFFDVAKIQHAVDITVANVVRLKAHKDAVTTRLKLRDVAKTELFRTEAELASAEADLIQTKNSLQLARTFLARLVGLETAFDIKEPDPAEANLDTDRLDRLKNLAFEHRAELKSLEIGEAIAANQVDYIKGAYWPRLSVEGVWTRLEQEPEPMLDESTYIGASLTFDLFDGGLRRARVGEARVQQKQAGLFLEDTKRSIAVEVEQSWRNWQTQQSVIESFESRLRYARANFDASERLFEHGAANSVDVIDANTLLVTAEQQLSESRYNLQLALLGIERSTGVYLEGIQDRLKQETAAPESNGQ